MFLYPPTPNSSYVGSSTNTVYRSPYGLPVNIDQRDAGGAIAQGWTPQAVLNPSYQQSSSLSIPQQGSLNTSIAPSLFNNPSAIPTQYNPADPQCVFARTLLAAPTQAPAGNEVGTLNAVPGGGTGATYDSNLGLIFDGVANHFVSFDVSNIASLQSSPTYMVYMEVERALISVLPASTGLSSTADFGGGIALTAAAEAWFSLWQTVDDGVPNDPTVRAEFDYTAGTGSKTITTYGAAGALNVTTIFAGDISRPDWDTHIPVVFAVDQTTSKAYLYVDGAYMYALSASQNVSGFAAKLGTIEFGRRFSGDSIASFSDGHIRNLMVIAGRSPLFGPSYGPQALAPASVFSKTLQLGDSYAGVVTGPSASQPANLVAGAALPAYLRSYGFALQNANEATNDYFNSTIMNACSFPGNHMIGWSTTSKPINANSADAAAFGGGFNFLWDQRATFIAQNPTCVLFQLPVNDFGGQYTSSLGNAYARWIRYWLEYLFGLNGNAATTVKAVCLITSSWPPFLSDGTSQQRRRGAAQAFKAAQAALAWFQATYPTLANNVILGDTYTALGGDSPYREYFVSFPTNDVHMGIVGKLLQYQVWGQTLLNLQSQLAGMSFLPSSIPPLASSLRSYQPPPLNAVRLLGQFRGANFNATTDQPIYLNMPQMTPAGTKYRISNIEITNASVSLTTAAGGFYTAAAKGGTVLVAAAQTYSALTTPGASMQATLAAGATGTAYSNQPTVVAQGPLATVPIYFSLTTPQGAAATADIYVFGYDLT